MITVKKFIVNPLRENSYLLFDETGQAIFIDPGFYYEEEFDEITGFVADQNLTPVGLVNTHCHFDHIFGVEFIRKTYNLEFACHQGDEFLIQRSVSQASMFGIEMGKIENPDRYISEGDEIRFGNSVLQTLHIPGHSPGHVVFHSPVDQILIAGDVLFQGSIGRTDLPGGDHNTLINNIKDKLLILPAETRVYSGHGPETTIGFEKKNNPFLT